MVLLAVVINIYRHFTDTNPEINPVTTMLILFQQCHNSVADPDRFP